MFDRGFSWKQRVTRMWLRTVLVVVVLLLSILFAAAPQSVAFAECTGSSCHCPGCYPFRSCERDAASGSAASPTSNRIEKGQAMAQRPSVSVTDIFPWPEGQGFSGADAWWEYVHQQDERVRLDFLIGVAMLTEELGKRLLQRDEALLASFQFSEETLAWLRGLRASSIQELASAIAHRQDSA